MDKRHFYKDKLASQDGNVQNKDEVEENLKHEQQEALKKWKKEIITIVCDGNIDGLENIMDEREFDINITWFQENLLMQAIRTEQVAMAEFLIDNGINYNFSKMVLDYNENSSFIDCYTINCRQLAYEHNLFQIVELIDEKNEEIFDFINVYNRSPRTHTPKTGIRKKSPELKTPETCEKSEKTPKKAPIKIRKDISNIWTENYKFRYHSLPSTFTLSLKGNNSEILFIQGKCKYGHVMGERCLSEEDISNIPFLLVKIKPKKYKNCIFLLSKQYTCPKIKNNNWFNKKPYTPSYSEEFNKQNRSRSFSPWMKG